MPTLYRDYRPQSFSELLGQNHIKITLQNEISADKIAQAFLFCGPRGIGKTTLARVLAKAVNCSNRASGTFEPCNQCANCLNITAGKNMDVVEIDAASNTGVDNVRDNIIAFSRISPSNSRFKVFIIDEVHMLSISAFNALLKIIEEPPSHVIFVLCTTEIHKVPLTIISRCERFDFKRLNVSDIVKRLAGIAATEKITIDRPVLEAIARRSGGHMRDAESLLGQIFSLGDKKITLEQAELVIPHYNNHEAVELLERLSRKDAVKAIGLVNNLVDNGVNIKNFIGEVISLVRKVMLAKLNPSLAENLGLDLGESLEIRLSQLVADLDWEQIFRITRRLIEAYNDNKNPLIIQLPLELALAELCLETPPAVLSAVSPGGGNWPKANPTAPKKGSVEPVKNKAATPLLSRSEVVKGPDLDLSLDQIKEKWPEFLVKIKKYNHSLSFVLQNCEPQVVKSGELSLVFKYKFHQDRINDSAIKEIVQNTLAEVFGAPLVFSSAIDENLELKREEKLAAEYPPIAPLATPAPPENQAAGGLISDLLKTFGGEVIN